MLWVGAHRALGRGRGSAAGAGEGRGSSPWQEGQGCVTLRSGLAETLDTRVYSPESSHWHGRVRPICDFVSTNTCKVERCRVRNRERADVPRGAGVRKYCEGKIARPVSRRCISLSIVILLRGLPLALYLRLKLRWKEDGTERVRSARVAQHAIVMISSSVVGARGRGRKAVKME